MALGRLTYLAFLILVGCDRSGVREPSNAASAKSIAGRYVSKVEGVTMSLDFRSDGSVLLYPESMRYLWERSNDTVFIHGGPQTRVELLFVHGDSLVSQLPGLVWVRAAKSPIR